MHDPTINELRETDEGRAFILETVRGLLTAPYIENRMMDKFDPKAFAYYRSDLWQAVNGATKTTKVSRSRGLRTMADIQGRAPSYFWEPYIPAAALTVVQGSKSSAKTWLTSKMLAEATVGGSLPGQGGPGDLRQLGGPKPVVLMQAEMNSEEMIRPRFDALGGDPSRIYYPEDMAAFRFGPDDEDLVSFLRLAWYWEAIKAETGYVPALTVIDPLKSFFSGTPNEDMAVRTTLQRFVALCSHYQVPVVFMLHWNKKEGSLATNRGSGSAEFGNVPRSSLVLTKDREAAADDPSAARDMRADFFVFHDKEVEYQGQTLGFTLRGKAIKRDPKDPEFSFAWRTDVDPKLSADEVVETSEDLRARDKATKPETAQRALLIQALDAGLQGLDHLEVSTIKKGMAAALGEEKVSQATYQRAYEGDPRNSKPPALPEGFRPQHLGGGRYAWPTLKPSPIGGPK